MAHVVVSRLTKKYGELEVVHGIDFEIVDREFLVLVGPSGCGKSTILRMIAGLETVTGGEIRIDDRVVNDMPPRERDIAMVFQDYALYPHAGDWLSGGVLAEAEDLNQPLLARPAKADAESLWRAVEVEGLQLGLSGFKPAEVGDGLILRTYEPAGARGLARVALASGWRVAEEVNLLEDPSGPADLAFTPFKLHSWKLVRS
jgi:multiple sugar transport system ATP-binding protein